ncbi:MAG TPA: hypothetical protein VJU82_06615 [Acidobacteriaceae bacterium]|jgi:hypothetical protein|nr:hypothetical protein [Acidobacteriaceae bacterium]
MSSQDAAVLRLSRGTFAAVSRALISMLIRLGGCLGHYPPAFGYYDGSVAILDTGEGQLQAIP